MKKFPHQQFIEENNISLDALPNQLKKRILGFDELENDLQHTTEHDQEQLIDKLENLSHELEEDLEEEFEDRLENNDEEEDDPHEHLVVPLVVETAEESNKQETTVEPTTVENIQDIESKESNEEIEREEPLSKDEEILENLYTSRLLKLSPAQLVRKGFKAKLDNKIIRVGKYALHRGKYDTCFQLLLNQK
jgi:hypothetical protein